MVMINLADGSQDTKVDLTKLCYGGTHTNRDRKLLGAH